MSHTLALDVGGTKIAWGVVPDSSPETVVASGRLPSRCDGSGYIDQIRAAVRSGLAAGYPISRLGVGSPGWVTAPRGKVTYAGETMPGWRGTDVRDVLADFRLPAAFLNDVRALAYSQRGPGRTLVVSLGTGVGGALLEGGALLPSATGGAGEISELRCADFRGQAVRCESAVSGTGLTRYYNDLLTGGDYRWGLPRATDILLPEIMQRWDAGESSATRVVEGNLTGFGHALGALATFLDVDKVVVGGGVAHAHPGVIALLSSGLRAGALPPKRDTPVELTRFSDHAPLIGAATYARDHAY